MESHEKLQSHYRFSESMKTRTLASFQEIFGSEYAGICKNISLRVYSLSKIKHNSLFDIFKNKILFGLHVILNSDESNEMWKIDLKSSWLFLHFFVLAFERGGEKFKITLRGRFKDGIRKESGFPALFLELNIIQSFLSKGHSAEIIEDEGAPDILVKSDFGDLHIECKCLDITAKPALPDGTVRLIAPVIADILNKESSAPYLLTMFYKGAPDEKLGNVESSAKEALRKLDVGKSYSNKNWSCKLDWLPKDIGPGEDEKIMTQRNYAEHKKLRGSILIAGENQGYCVIRSNREPRLDLAVRKIIDKAVDQLPKNGLRLITIQLLGSFSDARVFSSWRSFILRIITSNTDIMRRIDKENGKNNGFAGINFVSDFFTMDYDDEFGIDYWAMIFGGEDNKNVNLINYGFLKKPSNWMETFGYFDSQIKPRVFDKFLPGIGWSEAPVVIEKPK